MEQPRANTPLQFLHDRGRRRAWDAERIGGAGEARTLDDTGKNTEQINTIQGGRPSIRRNL